MAFQTFAARCLLAVALFASASAGWATDVLSYHNDPQSSGQNTSETQLTPANVAVGSFGKLFSTVVDGQVYAQPLYKAGVNITAGASAGLHNTVFVATEHDSLFAIDSSSGAVLWQVSFLTTGIAGATQITSVPAQYVSTQDLNPEIGITSTPVIDPGANVLYIEAKTEQIVSDPNLPHFVHTLYEVDLGSGAVIASTIIADTILSLNTFTFTYRTNNDPTSTAQDPFVAGTGDGAITIAGQSRVYFNALREANRPGLVLSAGVVYVVCASHGDNGPYHGWILGYDSTTLALRAALNTTPNGGLGGIWQAGGILGMDAEGYFYVETGNGTFDGNVDANGNTIGLDTNGFPVNSNFGDCFLKIALDPTTTQASQNANGWGLKIVDYFAPSNNQSLDESDGDLGSGGLLILPDSAGSSAHPHLLIGAGKEGKIFLVDRDNLGGFDPNTDHVVQTQGSAINGSLSTPAYFNGNIYWVGGYGDNGRIFTIANAAFSTSAASTTSDSFAFPGSTPSISANGLNNAIAWTIDRGTGQLRAYDATNFGNELWTSQQAANNADQLGTVVKFTVPTVADGEVFVGTNNTLVAYGPPPAPQAPPAAPTNLTASAASGIQINLAWTDNANNEAGFAIEQSPDGVNFTQIATVGVNAQSASVSGLDVATVYYFRVRAYNSFNTLSYSAYSNVTNATTSPQPPTLDFVSGFTTASGGATTLLSFVGNAQLTTNNTAELTDGNANEAGAVWSSQKQPVSSFTSEFLFQLTSAIANGFTFTVQNAGKEAIGGSGASLGYAGIKHSVCVKFDLYPNSSSTGLYLDGESPSEESRAIDMTTANIDLHSGDIFNVSLVYSHEVLTETVTDTQTNASFTKAYKVNIPATVGATYAYVGFTGGTGADTAVQNLQSWAYAPIPLHPAAVPSGVVATPASNTQINLTWKDNTISAAGYIVQRRTGSHGAFTQIGVTGATAPKQYMDTALPPNTTFYYRVLSTNGAGVSAPSATAHATTPIPPETPTKAHLTLVKTNRVDFAWKNNATNDTAYLILRKTSTQGDFINIATLPKNSTSYADKTVQPNTTYDYHIQCTNLAGFSDFAGLTVTTP